MAAMATPAVLQTSLSCVLPPSLSLPGATVSPTSSASCRPNLCIIRSRIPHAGSSLLRAPAVGASRFCDSGFENVFLRNSPLIWNPLPSRGWSALPAKKVSEIEVSVDKGSASARAEDEEEEEEVEISWVQEKAEDLVLATGNAIDRVPGPRVGQTRMPWLVALPLAYLGITFVLSVYKTYKKYTSPKGQRKRQVGKNAFLCDTLEEYFPSRRNELDSSKLHKLAHTCSFSNAEVLRKYIRYVLNERPFTPETVADLLHLRKISGLSEPEVADVLNDVAKRVVKAKGPVVMNTAGFTEKGIQRKAAVQALFSKLLYLSELEEFVSSDNRSALTIKTTFGVTDQDANLIRIDTLSERSDVESLERMVGSAEFDDEEVNSPASEDDEKK